MAGIVARPMLDKWHQDYMVGPPSKRAKVCSQAVSTFQKQTSQGHAPHTMWSEYYGAIGNQSFVPTPPPSISLPDACISRRSSEQDSPIRTRGGSGPQASLFCGAVTFLWFNAWPAAKAYLYAREMPHGIFAESFARPEFVKYTRFLIEKADVSVEILTLALLLIYRFRETQTKRRRTAPMDRHPTSEARVVVVALMTANKFLDDISYTTSTWSKMSGIDLSELKRMETEFLLGLDFKLHVTPKEWAAWERIVPTVLYPAIESLGRS